MTTVLARADTKAISVKAHCLQGPTIEIGNAVPFCDVRGGQEAFLVQFLTIFIGNLSWDAEREDLQHLFGQYGEVTKCSMPLDRDTGRKRGFAFVDLSQAADETSH